MSPDQCGQSVSSSRWCKYTLLAPSATNASHDDCPSQGLGEVFVARQSVGRREIWPKQFLEAYWKQSVGYPSPLFLLNLSHGKVSVGCRAFARCPIPWPRITSDGRAPKTGSIKMYVSELYASGFRRFGPDSPLTLNLRRGLNVLVGPNDFGKTAVIDAPGHVLQTSGDDFLRLEPGVFSCQA